jgi:hypothetical protein
LFRRSAMQTSQGPVSSYDLMGLHELRSYDRQSHYERLQQQLLSLLDALTIWGVCEIEKCGSEYCCNGGLDRWLYVTKTALHGVERR